MTIKIPLSSPDKGLDDVAVNQNGVHCSIIGYVDTGSQYLTKFVINASFCERYEFRAENSNNYEAGIYDTIVIDQSENVSAVFYIKNFGTYVLSCAQLSVFTDGGRNEYGS